MSQVSPSHAPMIPTETLLQIISNLPSSSNCCSFHTQLSGDFCSLRNLLETSPLIHSLTLPIFCQGIVLKESSYRDFLTWLRSNPQIIKKITKLVFLHDPEALFSLSGVRRITNSLLERYGFPTSASLPSTTGRKIRMAKLREEALDLLENLEELVSESLPNAANEERNRLPLQLISLMNENLGTIPKGLASIKKFTLIVSSNSSHSNLNPDFENLDSSLRILRPHHIVSITSLPNLQHLRLVGNWLHDICGQGEPILPAAAGTSTIKHLDLLYEDLIALKDLCLIPKRLISLSIGLTTLTSSGGLHLMEGLQQSGETLECLSLLPAPFFSDNGRIKPCWIDTFTTPLSHFSSLKHLTMMALDFLYSSTLSPSSSGFSLQTFPAKLRVLELRGPFSSELEDVRVEGLSLAQRKALGFNRVGIDDRSRQGIEVLVDLLVENRMPEGIEELRLEEHVLGNEGLKAACQSKDISLVEVEGFEKLRSR